MDQTSNRENKLPMERMLYEVKKVIVGQDHLLERLIVALACTRTYSCGRCAGPGKDDGDQDGG